MPRVAQARISRRLQVRGRELPFSFFPVGRGRRRKAVYDSLFATSPWAVMSGQINEELDNPEHRAEAQAFLGQARQFYATAGSYPSANPLLYYYAFLNLAKPLIRLRGFTGSLERSYHGLNGERDGNSEEPSDFRVVVQGQRAGRVNVFRELSKTLGFGLPPTGPQQVEDLMRQVVVGHRLWRQATRGAERFIGLESIELRQDSGAGEMWLRFLLQREDFGRFGVSHKEVLERSGFSEEFHEVKGDGIDHRLVAYEQEQVVDYGQRPNDYLDGLVDQFRSRLWRIISSDAAQGYRRYYLHLSDEPGASLPQLLSAWLLLFHYGSLVRYQPHVYAQMTGGRYGAFIQEFVAAQPEQLLYLFASEICQREVAKPAIA
jgi:hypothetical protein